MQCLSEKYKRRLLLFYEFFEIVKSQKDLCENADFIEEADLDTLERLFNQRQNLMNEIDQNNDEIVELISSQLPNSDSADVNNILKQIDICIKQINSLNMESQRALILKMSFVKNKIKQLRTGKHAYNAYMPFMRQVEGFFVDCK